MDNSKSIKPDFQGKHSELTKEIIGIFYDVCNELGYGFTERVYENAMVISLKKKAFSVKQQVPVSVYYDGQVVGDYVVDLLVNDLVILELKAVRKLSPEHEAQLLNYLKATEIEVGLVLNFGPKAEFIRRVLDNDRKGSLSWIKPSSSASSPKNP